MSLRLFGARPSWGPEMPKRGKKKEDEVVPEEKEAAGSNEAGRDWRRCPRDSVRIFQCFMACNAAMWCYVGATSFET